MKKCKTCALKDAKPCYECSACAGGGDHYRPLPEKAPQQVNEANRWILHRFTAVV